MQKYRSLILVLALVLFSAGATVFAVTRASAQQRQAPFCSSMIAPPSGWSGPLFHLSQDYPTVRPPDEIPWKGTDFRSQPAQYLMQILAYCAEGNAGPTDWDGARNPVRHWYHAPWMHTPPHGREPIHGLTAERVSEPLELGPYQKTRWQNYAVALYNPPGGWTLGQVWANHQAPDSSKIDFPIGTVAVKLLFTEAPVPEVPYLANAKAWEASIYDTPLPDPVPSPFTLPGRHRATLHLLQIDVAVRDPRAPLGWVFGTFCYNDALPSGSGWGKFAPVGLMTGNDPGRVTRGPLAETWINHSAYVPPQHLGWNGRLSGPVDNSKSSCISCHQTAQTGMPSPLIPAGYPEGSWKWMHWFRDLRLREPFDPGHISCEDSLQVAAGLQHFYASPAVRSRVPARTPTYDVTRSGLPNLLR